MHTPLTPDTDALPFLVIHGGWFWVVLVAAFVPVVTGIVAIARYIDGMRPRVRPTPLTWPTWIVAVLLALVLGYVTLYIVGRKLAEQFDAHRYDRGDGRPLEVGELDALSIAASMPGSISRDKALKHLASMLAMHNYRDERSIRRQLGLARLLGTECSELSLLDAVPEEQLALARRCGMPTAAFEILIGLGEYETAWTSRPPDLEWPYREGMVAIAIGNWAAAAKQAEKMVGLYREKKSTRDHAGKYQCLAHWFRFLAGEPGASEKLRSLAALAPGGHPAICAPMVAQTLPRDERIAYLRDVLATPIPEGRSVWAAHDMVEVSLWLAGEIPNQDRELLHPYDSDFTIGWGAIKPALWLTQFGVERWREVGNARQYAVALGGVVLRELHRGDFGAARRAADEAGRAARDDSFTRADARSWSTLIALREGQRELPPPERDEEAKALRLRRGEALPLDLDADPRESCAPLLRSAISAGQRGDGRALATAMQACSVSARSGVWTLMGVLPLVDRGRDELARALRWRVDTRELTSRAPFASVVYAAARRDLARFVEDEESAERWGRVAARHLAPLEDPSRALALVLWDL